MNRAERRAAGMKAKQPVYQMTTDAIEKIRKDAYQKAYESATYTAMVLLFSMPVRVMHEQYGWGTKRLTALAEALTDEYQRFSDGELSLEEYREFVLQETGFAFKKNPEVE
ncbi:MAG: hypothetical protein LIV24_08200 [Eubacterium sp.]|jgi:hypothetical protein|nr:hypothetical protein [Eubacterium sp.]HCW22791.1 hypothetical protein [Lachnospiraceae bacterium]